MKKKSFSWLMNFVLQSSRNKLNMSNLVSLNLTHVAPNFNNSDEVNPTSTDSSPARSTHKNLEYALLTSALPNLRSLMPPYLKNILPMMVSKSFPPSTCLVMMTRLPFCLLVKISPFLVLILLL